MGIENLLAGAIDYAAADAIADSAIRDVKDIGQQALTESGNLATEVAGMTNFQPFTVATGTGGATATDTGGFTTTLSPQAQALQNLGLSGAQGFMTGIGQDRMSQLLGGQAYRSEERRVGKECRSRGVPYH